MLNEQEHAGLVRRQRVVVNGMRQAIPDKVPVLLASGISMCQGMCEKITPQDRPQPIHLGIGRVRP